MKELTVKQNRKIAISLYVICVCDAVLSIFSVADQIMSSGFGFHTDLTTYLLLSLAVVTEVLASDYWRRSKIKDDN